MVGRCLLVGARDAYLVPESQITISPGNGAKIKSLSLLEQRARAHAYETETRYDRQQAKRGGTPRVEIRRGQALRERNGREWEGEVMEVRGDGANDKER